MTAQIGQRWLWKTTNGRSEVILEVYGTRSPDYVLCEYIQVIKKGYDVDNVGHRDTLTRNTIENSPTEFIYLEGQDKPV